MKASDKFIVYGKVLIKENKLALPSVIVEAYDKDLLFDDRLGSALTNQKGEFAIKFQKHDFQEFFFEQKPDLYILVRNQEGKIIHTTKDNVRHRANHKEAFIIRIPKSHIGFIPSYSVETKNGSFIDNIVN